MEKEFVIGVAGASGIIYAQRLLETLCGSAVVHLIISEQAEKIAAIEGIRLRDFDALYTENSDLAAEIASGSFRHDGMAIVPCSMKSLAAISSGFSDTLITRAADVCLKERRKCILLLREMPFSRIHLKNMLDADEAGAMIMVASPPFYHKPQTIDDLVDMVVARVLDHLGAEHSTGTRWRGE